MFRDTLSEHAVAALLGEAVPVREAPGLMVLVSDDAAERSACAAVESAGAFKAMQELHDEMREDLIRLLHLRERDTAFVASRTHGFVKFNADVGNPWESAEYHTIIGLEDAEGRIVVGPNIVKPEPPPGGPPPRGPRDAVIPHVTLMRPGVDGKRAVNSMNAMHRKVAGEPKVVQDLIEDAPATSTPLWVNDCADGLTPTRHNVALANLRFRECVTAEAGHVEQQSARIYTLADEGLMRTAKLCPSFALPCPFLFRRPSAKPAEPVPLLIYDLLLHMANNARRPDVMQFFLTKLETEEEAAVMAKLIARAEAMIQKHVEPAYTAGSARVFFTVESPRAMFRIGDMAAAFGNAFAGVQLRWETFIAATAKLFRNDAGYAMAPIQDTVKARTMLEPVHRHVVEEVRRFGGVAISGMFSEMPLEREMHDFRAPSFQLAMKRFFITSATALARSFDGFFMSDPLFVRYGAALVEAFAQRQSGKRADAVAELVRAVLLNERDQQEVLSVLEDLDARAKQPPRKLCPRELLAVDVHPSAAHRRLAAADPARRPRHLASIRGKAFIALQSLACWVAGRGNVSVLAPHPTQLPLRRTVNRGTVEAFRWDVWRMIRHRGLPVEDVVRVTHEALHDIRRGVSEADRAVVMPYTAVTATWYRIALRLWLRVVTDHDPPDHLAELLMVFCIPVVRSAASPWAAAASIDQVKYGSTPDARL